MAKCSTCPWNWRISPNYAPQRTPRNAEATPKKCFLTWMDRIDPDASGFIRV